MLNKTWKVYFLYHSCPIWVVIAAGNSKILKNNYETFEAWIDRIFSYIKAEGRNLIFYKKKLDCIILCFLV